MSLDPYLLLAEQRQRALRSEATRRALIRLATCCRPSAWRRAVDAWRARSPHVVVCCS